MSANALEAFLAVMADGHQPDRMQVGFGVLIDKDAPERFLEPLQRAGLLSPVQAHTLRDARTDFSVWPAGPYIVAVAKRARSIGDEDLARAVLGIVRTVTAKGNEIGVRDNYQIWRQCAEIVGLLPISMLEDEDIAQVDTWLSSPFDTSLVAIELSKGLLPKLLEKGDEQSKVRVLEVLRLLTEYEITEDAGRRAVKSRVQPYWLDKILEKHAKALGQVGGRPVVRLLVDRVAPLFEDPALRPTWLARPAIEDNPQNLKRHDVKEALIDALRDSAAAVDDGGGGAAEVVSELLASGSEIVFRVGLHVARVRFDVSAPAIADSMRGEWFSSGGRHELYLLLRDHFKDFEPALKERLLTIFRDLPRHRQQDEESQLRGERFWLLAISGSGDPAVAQRLAVLDAQLGPAPAEQHEGLLAHFESSYGPGPSPYSPAALQSLADRGVLVEILNAFVAGDDWRGPTVTSLVNALEEAIVESPEKFLMLHADFLKAKPAYQVGFLSGFAALWEKGRQQKEPTLSASAWEVLLNFAAEVSGAVDVNTHDDAAEPLMPQSTWLPGLIADWIDAGVKDDDHAMDVSLLQHAKELLVRLLTLVEPAKDVDADSDAVMVAINAPRGKIIEALIGLALRAKRTNQEEALIDSVLKVLSDALQVGDLEAVTLLATSIAQMNYLQPGWVEARFHQLFPVDDDRRLSWGLRGLAYARQLQWLHALLKGAGIYLSALRLRSHLGQAWESVLDRMAVAYLQGDDTLGDPFWASLVGDHDYESLQHVTWFLWTQREAPLTEIQKQRVLAFWDHLQDRVDAHRPGGWQLKGNLGLLAWALPADDRRAERLLPSAGSYVQQVYHDYDFAQELARIAPVQPVVVMSALEAMLANEVPVIDYEDGYLNLLRALYAAGQVERVVGATNRLRNIPDIRAFYDEIRDK